jgi:small subunit ribosomal protein S20
VANHKSAEKRNRQSEVRRVRNKTKSSQTRNQVKGLRAAIESGDKETANKLLTVVQSLFSKLSKTSAMRKDTAGRRTSRLASQVSKL